MEATTIVRVVAGVLALLVLGVIIYRRRHNA
jgi:LPXTG-motif cell wall-anchored protein